ncbi:hypothetical protein [Aquimarina sediminis]|uniref:hypothetical protein n=1 Tax=Aquimarina sediminis TaxID=2070536 RepID=UPI000CA06030|nr:hypothetical protein [Aquimarina sediminis]
MKKLFTCILTCLSILVTGCYKDHEIPIANLKYIKFKTKQNKLSSLPIYEVYFSSDIHIDSLLTEKGDLPRLYCSINGEENFNIENIDNDQVYFSGFFDKKSSRKKKEKILYKTEMTFYKKNSTNKVRLTQEEIKKNLLEIECIPCKIEERFYLNVYKPYLSNPMCIPVKDILEVLEE